MRRFLAAAALLLLLAGCSAKEPALSTAVTSVEQRNTLALLGEPYTYNAWFWDYVPPEGTKSLDVWVEYYEDGVRAPSVNTPMRLPLTGGEGSIAMAAAPQTNEQYKSSLGAVDFFDHPILASWQVRVMEKDAATVTTFHTGYDFYNTYRGGDDYQVTRFQLHGTAPLTLEEEYTVLCLALAKDFQGDGNITAVPAVLKDYAYAYLIKFRFTGEER